MVCVSASYIRQNELIEKFFQKIKPKRSFLCCKGRSTGKEARKFGYIGTNFKRYRKRNLHSSRKQIKVAGKNIKTDFILGQKSK